MSTKSIWDNEEEKQIDLDAAQARLAKMDLPLPATLPTAHTLNGGTQFASVGKPVSTSKLDITRGDSGNPHDKGISEEQYGAELANMRPDDAFRAAQEGKPKRAPAVKGKCANCGKNWSRHVFYVGKDTPYCSATAGDLKQFTLEPIAAEQPAQGAGGITQADADDLKDLASEVHRCAEVERLSWDAHQDRIIATLSAKGAFNAKLDSLVKGGA